MNLSFQQLCEFLTCNQKYSWFYFTPELLNCLAPEDLESVKIETLHDGGIRIWYPKEKYIPPAKEKITILNLPTKLANAIQKGDMVETAKLQQILKLLKGTT